MLKIVCCVLTIKIVASYLDVLMTVKRNQNFIQYAVPISVNQTDYFFGITFQNTQQFIAPLKQKTVKNKKQKKHKSKQDNNQQLIGKLRTSSLEGYSFEGWKRFFMQALLYIESRYYHEIAIDFSPISKKIVTDNSTNETLDGRISFGPDMENNQIYKIIKSQNQFVRNDVVSIYRGVNDKNVRMQLGGFEESFARGYRNGILFYQLVINSRDNKWWVPVKSVSCLKSKNGKDDIFYIASSQIELSISIQSPLLILPKSFASQIQRNFQSVHTVCKITQNSRLSCSNMTSIDLSLDFIQLKIDTGAYINISLYDLRDQYKQQTNQTTFFIEFSENEQKLQLGQAFFKSYYVSIDMSNKRMLFSPINRYPTEYYGIYLIRFFVGFGIFTIAAGFFAMIWQNFNDPFRKNKLLLQQDGVRLVTYQRPADVDNQIEQ